MEYLDFTNVNAAVFDELPKNSIFILHSNNNYSESKEYAIPEVASFFLKHKIINTLGCINFSDSQFITFADVELFCFSTSFSHTVNLDFKIDKLNVDGVLSFNYKIKDENTLNPVDYKIHFSNFGPSLPKKIKTKDVQSFYSNIYLDSDFNIIGYICEHIYTKSLTIANTNSNVNKRLYLKYYFNQQGIYRKTIRSHLFKQLVASIPIYVEIDIPIHSNHKDYDEFFIAAIAYAYFMPSSFFSNNLNFTMSSIDDDGDIVKFDHELFNFYRDPLLKENFYDILDVVEMDEC